ASEERLRISRAPKELRHTQRARLPEDAIASRQQRGSERRRLAVGGGRQRLQEAVPVTPEVGGQQEDREALEQPPGWTPPAAETEKESDRRGGPHRAPALAAQILQGEAPARRRQDGEGVGDDEPGGDAGDLEEQ